ncbi:MAG: hypothetical protein ACRD3W_19725 [Terriglobales bacterium]
MAGVAAGDSLAKAKLTLNANKARTNVNLLTIDGSGLGAERSSIIVRLQTEAESFHPGRPQLRGFLSFLRD